MFEDRIPPEILKLLRTTPEPKPKAIPLPHEAMFEGDHDQAEAEDRIGESISAYARAISNLTHQLIEAVRTYPEFRLIQEPTLDAYALNLIRIFEAGAKFSALAEYCEDLQASLEAQYGQVSFVRAMLGEGDYVEINQYRVTRQRHRLALVFPDPDELPEGAPVDPPAGG